MDTVEERALIERNYKALLSTIQRYEAQLSELKNSLNEANKKIVLLDKRLNEAESKVLMLEVMNVGNGATS